MRDRDFLIWIHERMTCVHGEAHHIDYMGKLRSIIAAMNPEQETPNTAPALPGEYKAELMPESAHADPDAVIEGDYSPRARQA